MRNVSIVLVHFKSCLYKNCLCSQTRIICISVNFKRYFCLIVDLAGIKLYSRRGSRGLEEKSNPVIFLSSQKTNLKKWSSNFFPAYNIKKNSILSFSLFRAISDLHSNCIGAHKCISCQKFAVKIAPLYVFSADENTAFWM